MCESRPSWLHLMRHTGTTACDRRPRRPQTLALVLLTLMVIGCKRSEEHRAPEPAPPSSIHGSAADRSPAPLPGEAAAAATPVELSGPRAPGMVFSGGIAGELEPCGCSEENLAGGIERVAGCVTAAREQLESPLVVELGDLLAPEATLQMRDMEAALRRAEVLSAYLAESRVSLFAPGPRDLALGAARLAAILSEHDITALSANMPAQDGLTPVALAEEELAGLNVCIGAATLDEGESAEGGPRYGDAEVTLRAAFEEATSCDFRVVILHGSDREVADLLRRLGGGMIDLALSPGDQRFNDVLREPGGVPWLRLHSRGRAIATVKLFAGAGSPGDWARAESGAATEIETLEELIARLDAQLARIADASEGQQGENPLVARLRERRSGYEADLNAARQAGQEPNLDATRNMFVLDVIPVVPGRPTNDALAASRQQYNRALEAIAARNAVPPSPPAEGEAGYIGAAQCQSCHSAASAHWATTAHASAWRTLEERDKTFDAACVGCHVTGWQAPGGSTLSHHEGLENVQCESCHGPGSLHAAAPSAEARRASIRREVPTSVCLDCHNVEHSPGFDETLYRPQLLGVGHTAR